MTGCLLLQVIARQRLYYALLEDLTVLNGETVMQPKFCMRIRLPHQ